MVTIAAAGSVNGLAAALAMFDGPDALSSSHAQLLMLFAGVAALALVMQALVFVLMAVGAMRAQKRITAIAEEFQAIAHPLIKKTQLMVDDLSPKVRDIAENLSDITAVVRAKAHELEPTITAVNETFTDANLKTRAQVTKVDGMITSALNATTELATMVHQGIRGPMREVVGLINGLKIGFETLIQRSRAAASAPPPYTPPTPRPSSVVDPDGPAPDAAPAAAAEVRNEMSFAAYRAAMQAKRRDLDL